MSEQIEQTKKSEVLYLIFFLIVGRVKPTPTRAQQVLREASGLWSITTADIPTYWPANLDIRRYEAATLIRVDSATYSLEVH